MLVTSFIAAAAAAKWITVAKIMVTAGSGLKAIYYWAEQNKESNKKGKHIC